MDIGEAQVAPRAGILLLELALSRKEANKSEQ
jgi:hypothetical protein